MSWNQIAAALKNRLSTVMRMGKTYAYQPWTDEAPASGVFQEMFVHNGALNCWYIEVSPVGGSTTIHPDSDRVYRKIYSAKLVGMYAHGGKSFEIFPEICDGVEQAFRQGERTLGGQCLTYQLPTAQGPSMVNFMGVLCHSCTYGFSIEEEVRNAVASTDQPADGLTGQVLRMDEIAKALIAFLAPQMVPSVIPDVGHMVVDRNMDDAAYPASPRTSLSQVRLRVDMGAVAPAALAAGQVSDFEMKITMKLLQKQIPGGDHQVRMTQALEQLSNPFLGKFQPAQVLGIPNLLTYTVTPAVITPIGVLRHEWDDPSLRVSKGTVEFVIRGRTKADGIP